jgi:hypothetical protein
LPPLLAIGEAAFGYVLLASFVVTLARALDVHPYARVADWHRDFEREILGLSPTKSGGPMFYRLDWKRPGEDD